MLGPAGSLLNIEPGVIYLKKGERPIFSIHCTKTNECEVIVFSPSGNPVVFPIGSFVQGAVYHIFIKKMEFDKDKASFIGYRLIHKEKKEEK